jgi:hypothetical protein
MERNNTKSWQNKFVIALSNNDVEEIGRLQETIPEPSSTQEAIELKNLIGEGIILCRKEKNILSKNIILIEKSKKYMPQDSISSFSNFDSRF